MRDEWAIPDDGLRCSGLLPDKRCKHGFRAGHACWPVSAEAAARLVPMCCDEEATAELFEFNGGMPLRSALEAKP
mgnify:CR=1 FL=1